MGVASLAGGHIFWLAPAKGVGFDRRENLFF